MAPMGKRRRAVLAAMSLGSVAAMPVQIPELRARSLVSAYQESVALCRHGNDGLVIALDEMADPERFVKELMGNASLPQHREQTLIRKAFSLLKAVALESIHPESLDWVFNHTQTRRVEASCIHIRELPQPRSLHASAALFGGRYHEGGDLPLQPTCKKWINIANPLKVNSRATLFYQTPAGRGDENDQEKKFLMTYPVDCAADGSNTVTKNMSATIHMVADHVGNISVVGSDLHGYYVLDANGREEDHIKWSDGITWSKTQGGPYDLDSDIGPINHANGTRTRNPDALPRWNWGLDRLDGPYSTLDDQYVYGDITGNGTTLYNLDSGVMITHDDFGGRAIGGYSAGCPTGEENGCKKGWAHKAEITMDIMGRPGSCSTHGTHTASTAAGDKYGVANEAEVIAVQVLNCSGSGSTAHVIDGIEWAVQHAVERQPRRPSVLALSLGAEDRSWMIDSSVKLANSLGLLVVVAAGNDAKDACHASPAAAQYAITVGATEMEEVLMHDDDGLVPATKPRDSIADFSAYGSCVNVFAPGVEILAAVPTTYSTHIASIMSGTSMSTPLVAGVALQIYSMFPEFGPDDATRAILCSCVQGAIFGVSTHTHNCLLQGGAQLGEAPLVGLLASQQELTLADREAGKQPQRDATQCYYADAASSEGERSATSPTYVTPYELVVEPSSGDDETKSTKSGKWEGTGLAEGLSEAPLEFSEEVSAQALLPA